MTKYSLVASGLAVALLVIPTVQAQDTLDVSKVTCRQFLEYKITNPERFAIWLSGYYHGKRGDTIVDRPGFSGNYKRLREYCVQNPKSALMQAVDTLFSTSK
jgi:acid stress chaperone HdeB